MSVLCLLMFWSAIFTAVMNAIISELLGQRIKFLLGGLP